MLFCIFCGKFPAWAFFCLSQFPTNPTVQMVIFHYNKGSWRLFVPKKPPHLERRCMEGNGLAGDTRVLASWMSWQECGLKSCSALAWPTPSHQIILCFHKSLCLGTVHLPPLAQSFQTTRAEFCLNILSIKTVGFHVLHNRGWRSRDGIVFLGVCKSVCFIRQLGPARLRGSTTAGFELVLF